EAGASRSTLRPLLRGRGGSGGTSGFLPESARGAPLPMVPVAPMTMIRTPAGGLARPTAVVRGGAGRRSRLPEPAQNRGRDRGLPQRNRSGLAPLRPTPRASMWWHGLQSLALIGGER